MIVLKLALFFLLNLDSIDRQLTKLFFFTILHLLFFFRCFFPLIFIRTHLLDKKFLAIGVDSLDIISIANIILHLFYDFHFKIIDDALNTLMPHHHLLMMTFDLMRVSRSEKFGDMSEYFYPLSFLMRIEIVSKVLEISDINIVLSKIPTVELQITGFFLDHL